MPVTVLNSQHVGITFQKKGSGTVDLAQRFRDALFRLCPNDNPSDRACSYDDEQRLDNIYYNRGMNSYVGIKVASYEIPTGLRPLFINTLWGVFKEITECDVSRYQLRGWKNHEACREFANSADQIEVRLENSRGPNEKPGTFTDPHLRVQIAFNGKTDEGQFDCVGTQSSIWYVYPSSIQHHTSLHLLTQSYRDQVRQRMVPEIAKKYNDAQVDFDVVCVTPRVDGNCNSVICKSDSRWTDTPGFEGEDGSCHWHNKCSTPDHCIFSL